MCRLPKRSCCGCPVRDGSLILMWITIVPWILIFLGYLFYTENKTFWIFIFLLFPCIGSGLGIYGTMKGKNNFIIPYFIYRVFWAIIHGFLLASGLLAIFGISALQNTLQNSLQHTFQNSFKNMDTFGQPSNTPFSDSMSENSSSSIGVFSFSLIAILFFLFALEIHFTQLIAAAYVELRNESITVVYRAGNMSMQAEYNKPQIVVHGTSAVMC